MWPTRASSSMISIFCIGSGLGCGKKFRVRIEKKFNAMKFFVNGLNESSGGSQIFVHGQLLEPTQQRHESDHATSSTGPGATMGQGSNSIALPFGIGDLQFLQLFSRLLEIQGDQLAKAIGKASRK